MVQALRDAPAWFQAAIAVKSTQQDVAAAGVRLRVHSWLPRSPGLPKLLLVHGFLANAHWWDWTAPLLTDLFEVHAMELSGMGQSDHRQVYDIASWQKEIADVAASLGGPVVALGHSFGGARVLEAAVRYPDLFRHAVLLDSYIHFAEYPARPEARALRSAASRFASEGEALSRYRLMPDQAAPRYVLDYLAKHSIRRVNGAWSWQFDEVELSAPRGLPDSTEMLSQCRVPLTLVHGELSRIASRDRMARVRARCAAVEATIEIPHAAHHVMVDEPLALVECLRSVFRRTEG